MANSGQQNRPDDNADYRENSQVSYPNRPDLGTGPKQTEVGEDLGVSSVEFAQAGTYERTAADLPPGEDPPNESAIGGLSQEEENQYASSLKRESWLIQRAQEIYTSSTDYLDANITNQWETNLSHFNNEHAPSTPFRQQNFKRSNVFRPKTRSNVKTGDAAMAVAAFSTHDLVDIRPQNPKSEMQIASAKVTKWLLQYRLASRMPWFQTVIGAYQDTKVYGLCITHQYWKYEVDTDILPALDDNGKLIMDRDEDGNDVPMGYEDVKVRVDELVCDNVAPENFRFDPMCDWRDPAGTSPFLIYMMPIYAGDALEMMEKIDDKTGQPTWKKHPLGSILGTRRQDYSRTRQAREGRERIDPADEQHGNSFTTLWAHFNIIKVNGEDIGYWTMGTELLLTDPLPLTTLYPWLDEGERPFVVGFSTIETHRNYPAGDVEQGSGLQEEINVVANQRLDNVKLVLNKRYYIRRGSQVDLDALVRNVPGGGVMMNDPEKDVKTVDTRDVTGSSYQEQDRLSVEFDELVGNFSQSSVQGNRALNETVGGMDLMSQGAGAIQDFSIRIFIETWMEPALRQLTKLVQMYETDEVLLELAGQAAELMARFGMNEITDDLLRQNLITQINVGMGNTDPVKRVERLVFGTTKVLELPGMVERVKSSAIADEIFGSVGFRDANRFFMTDEEYAQHQEEMGPPPPPPDIEVKMRELDVREADNTMRDEREVVKMQQEVDLSYAKLASERGIKLEELYKRLDLEAQRDQTVRDIAALRERNKSQEINVKRAQGSGI